MFCPKCASANADDTKYCRGCGADLSSVLAVIDGRPPNVSAYAEKHIELFGSGLRGVMIGSGFLLVGLIAVGISMRLAVATIFAFAFAAFFLGAGVARLVQARSLKKLYEPKASDAAELVAGEPQYLQPPRSIYQTDDLITPRSVTEKTTRHLSIDESTRDRE